MPIQPCLPSSPAELRREAYSSWRSGPRVFTLGSVSLRKARTSTRSASASGGRWNGGNSSLGMDIGLLGGWMLPLCRLILDRATRGVSRVECRAARPACRRSWRNSTTTSARPCWRPTAPSTAPSTSATTTPWSSSGRRPARWSACIPARGRCTTGPRSWQLAGHPGPSRFAPRALHRRMGRRPRRPRHRGLPRDPGQRPAHGDQQLRAPGRRLAHRRPPFRPGASGRAPRRRRRRGAAPCAGPAQAALSDALRSRGG